ncbi:hypothetical protein SUGI_0305350 [Cryptomeria japonica]|nr:hypothetical protein SUGI_0305350 [Cryptomeria japonica]
MEGQFGEVFSVPNGRERTKNKVFVSALQGLARRGEGLCFEGLSLPLLLRRVRTYAEWMVDSRSEKMKFQKQLKAQLVAEWINAYVNYKQLKKDIKQIREQIASKEDHPVTNKLSASSFLLIDGQIVHHEIRENSNGGMEMVYQTELVCGQETDRVFFSRLDSQLNMVNKFYRAKENECLVRGEQLQTQLETLIDIKQALPRSKIYDHSTRQEIDIGI